LTGFTLTTTTWASVALSNAKLYVGKSTSTLDYVQAWTIGATSIDFGTLTQNLEEGDNYVQVKADVNTSADTESIASPTTPLKFALNITDVTVNGKAKGRKSSTYFAKWFFVLSKKTTSDGSLQVEVKNNSDQAVEIMAIGIDSVSGNVATASVGNKNVGTWTNAANATANIVDNQTVVIDANGGSETIYLTAAKDKTVKLTKILYKVVDGDDTYTYLATDANTKFGTWGQLYSTK